MNNQENISVIGCGWLGLPLAIDLVKKGYQVKGSTTSQSKIETLKNNAIDPYLIHFSKNSEEPDSEILNSGILIINIPPGRRSEEGATNYRIMADYFYKVIPDSSVQKIILVSSTSVYNDINSTVFEADKHLPESDAGKLLLEVENQFLSIKNKKVIILRLCGLTGPGRDPARFFKNKNFIPNGLAPINLVHLDDVIGVILNIISDENASGIYNCCSTSHPTKDEFYSIASKLAGNKIPDFILEKKMWKEVASLRIQKELGYKFKYPNLLEWLNNGQL